MKKVQKEDWEYPQKDRTRSIRLDKSQKQKKYDSNFTLKPIKKEKRKANINYLRIWDSDFEDL